MGASRPHLLHTLLFARAAANRLPVSRSGLLRIRFDIGADPIRMLLIRAVFNASSTFRSFRPDDRAPPTTACVYVSPRVRTLAVNWPNGTGRSTARTLCPNGACDRKLYSPKRGRDVPATAAGTAALRGAKAELPCQLTQAARVRLVSSAVVGSITVRISDTLLAGNPPSFACCRISSSESAK
jgi:hypothetical protein